jgi:hypothetical protein
VGDVVKVEVARDKGRTTVAVRLLDSPAQQQRPAIRR